MIKYRIFTKSLIADNLDETEEYDPPKPNRLGRDPDLH